MLKEFCTYQLGDEIPLQVRCYDAAGAAVAPDAAPTIRFYRDAVATADVTGVRIESQDVYGITGLFCGKIVLDGRFATGAWTAVYSWDSGAFAGKELEAFEIVGGGDIRGSILSLAFYDKRSASHLVWQTNAGAVISARGPRVS